MKKLSFYLLSAIIILCISCTKKNSQESKAKESEKSMSNQQEQTSPTLKSMLDKKKQTFELTADDKTKKIYKDGIDAIRDSQIVENAKQVGEKAPNFTLTNASGNKVELYKYLEKGPVILIWYRGGWCPYCNLTLNRLQAELPNFKANGATLIALTPELPDKSISTAEKNNLQFEVLSDIGSKVAKDYGVVFTLTPEVAEIYNNKFGLSEYNGTDSNELPLAATYVINQDGIIVYAFLDADYRNRAEPSTLTEVVKSIKK